MNNSQVIEKIQSSKDWGGYFNNNSYDCFQAFLQTYLHRNNLKQNSSIDYKELGTYHFNNSKHFTARGSNV